jgi:hypothetical protein
MSFTLLRMGLPAADLRRVGKCIMLGHESIFTVNKYGQAP